MDEHGFSNSLNQALMVEEWIETLPYSQQVDHCRLFLVLL